MKNLNGPGFEKCIEPMVGADAYIAAQGEGAEPGVVQANTAGG